MIILFHIYTNHRPAVSREWGYQKTSIICLRQRQNAIFGVHEQFDKVKFEPSFFSVVSTYRSKNRQNGQFRVLIKMMFGLGNYGKHVIFNYLCNNNVSYSFRMHLLAYFILFYQRGSLSIEFVASERTGEDRMSPPIVRKTKTANICFDLVPSPKHVLESIKIPY